MICPVNRKKGKAMLLGKKARSACRWTLIKRGINEGKLFQRISGHLIQQIGQLSNKVDQLSYFTGSSCFIALGVEI